MAPTINHDLTTKSPQTVTEGQDITLTCVVSAEPPASIMWIYFNPNNPDAKDRKSSQFYAQCEHNLEHKIEETFDRLKRPLTIVMTLHLLSSNNFFMSTVTKHHGNVLHLVIFLTLYFITFRMHQKCCTLDMIRRKSKEITHLHTDHWFLLLWLKK